MSKQKYQQLLFEAVGSELGKKIQTNSPERLRQKLYPLCKKTPAFSNIKLVIPPNRDDQLWIINLPESKDGQT